MYVFVRYLFYNIICCVDSLNNYFSREKCVYKMSLLTHFAAHVQHAVTERLTDTDELPHTLKL